LSKANITNDTLLKYYSPQLRSWQCNCDTGPEAIPETQ